MKIYHVSSVHIYNDTRILYKECYSSSKIADTTFLSLNGSFEKDVVYTENYKTRVLSLKKDSNRIARMSLGLLRLFRRIRKDKPDIVQLHDTELLLIAPLLKVFGFNVIYDIHEDMVTGIMDRDYAPLWIRKCFSTLIPIAENILSIGCRQVIAEKEYAYRFPVAVPILNYPIVQTFEQHDLSEYFSTFNKQYRWCIYSGHVTEKRGAITQLNLLKANPEMALFYIGKCDQLLYQKMVSYLENNSISRDRLIVKGVEEFIDRSVIDSAYKSFNWFAGLAVFPYSRDYEKKELTKFFEYLLYGIPIIATKYPMWQQFMQENRAGVVIDSLMGDFAVDSKQIEALHQRVPTKTFTWESEEQKLFNLYCTMVPCSINMIKEKSHAY